MPARTATQPAPTTLHSPMEHPRHQYPQETEALQGIAEQCGLTEQIKWGKPCYTLAGKNIVLIQRFNHYIALMFFKGALLNDPENFLHRIGKHMQAPRQLRFGTVAEITRAQTTIADFIRQAIDLERTGAKVPRKPSSDVAPPEELQARLRTDPALQAAFAALTPGRRKAYIFQIAAAKLPSTRASRVEKYAPRILAGKGLHD